jgi:hypothetical protein
MVVHWAYMAMGRLKLFMGWWKLMWYSDLKAIFRKNFLLLEVKNETINK